MKEFTYEGTTVKFQAISGEVLESNVNQHLWIRTDSGKEFAMERPNGVAYLTGHNVEIIQAVKSDSLKYDLNCLFINKTAQTYTIIDSYGPSEEMREDNEKNKGKVSWNIISYVNPILDILHSLPRTSESLLRKANAYLWTFAIFFIIASIFTPDSSFILRQQFWWFTLVLGGFFTILDLSNTNFRARSRVYRAVEPGLKSHLKELAKSRLDSTVTA